MAKTSLRFALFSVALLGVSTPVMAMPREEYRCAIEGAPKTLQAQAYHFWMTPDATAPEDLREAAAFTLLFGARVDACQAKHHWSDKTAALMQSYSIADLAAGHALGLMAQAGVDLTPLVTVFEAMTAAEWDAVERKDRSSPVYVRLGTVLAQQGFDVEKNSAVFHHLGEILGTLVAQRGIAAALFIPFP
jgi:hypothetical protein